MLPAGLIILWSGAIVNIPAGWVLCDGNNGTPDLRNRFLVGAGGVYSVDDTGGQGLHTHTFTGDGHVHVLGIGPDIEIGTDFSSITDTTQVTGTTNLGSNLPPYHALAYIMKT